MNRLHFLVVAAALLLFAGTASFAQSDNDATRRLWDTAFITSKKANAKPKRKRPQRTYRVNTPNVSTEGVESDSVIGVTIWRLRRSTSSDAGERIIVHDEDEDVEWLPERISANAKLLPGDRLRISVEAARSGYLYVIDREQYADGSLGEPHLVFPTTRTLNGDNRVQIGKLIEIPAQEDAPPYFRVRRSRPDHVAEVLSVFVTPTPLEGITIGDKAQKLSQDQVAVWEKQWSTQVGSIELEGGAGKRWTKEERQAASGGPQVLNASAPTPQTIYYRPKAKATEPLMVKVALRYHTQRKQTAN
ncbi:MAG TPA: hypothetical protein VJ023_06330 [Pyrinomonadaceae bacterium]|nr:hypothetical protein [Pyrinomonadaceae bacterium]